MSAQHCQCRSRIQNMFCMKDGRKYFDKSFKQLFCYNTSSAVLAVIKNEAKNCTVQEMAESSGETLLHLAAKYGQVAVATYLISNGCDVEARTGECGCTPLILSAAYGHADVCQLLLDANADMFTTNFLGESALHAVTTWKSYISDYSHLTLFTNKLTSLHLSDEELATKLIQANSPMYYIVHLNNARVTAMLRERGYTIPKSSPRYILMLHDAVVCRNLENVKFILEQTDIDVNLLDNYDYAPMHYATESGDVKVNLSIIKFLLDKGADINVQGTYGMTPLFCALNGYMPNEQKKRCIYFLLQNGADPQILDYNGDTIIDYAMRKSLMDIYFDETTLDPVLSHLALQEALGLPIIDKLREQIDSDETRKYYYILCQRCLEDMKQITVKGEVNLYKILTESDQKVLEYMRNFETAVNFAKTTFLSNFYYKYVMKRRFFRVMDMIKKEKLSESV